MREHFQRPLRDETGQLLTGASIRLLEPGTTDPIAEPIYDTLTDATEHTPPWVAADGIIDFYLQYPKVVRIGVTRDGEVVESYFENVMVGAVDESVETVSIPVHGAVPEGDYALRAYLDQDGRIENVRISLGVVADTDLTVDVQINGGSGVPVTVLAGENTAYLDVLPPYEVAAGDYFTLNHTHANPATTVPGEFLNAQVRVRH